MFFVNTKIDWFDFLVSPEVTYQPSSAVYRRGAPGHLVTWSPGQLLRTTIMHMCGQVTSGNFRRHQGEERKEIINYENNKCMVSLEGCALLQTKGNTGNSIKLLVIGLHSITVEVTHLVALPNILLSMQFLCTYM